LIPKDFSPGWAREKFTEALWGMRVSPSTVSNLNKKIYVKIEACFPVRAKFHMRYTMVRFPKDQIKGKITCPQE
jgi:hypothetical protein